MMNTDNVGNWIGGQKAAVEEKVQKDEVRRLFECRE